MPHPARHAQIRADLEEAIRSGALPPGSLVPTERDLATRYAVSRGTVQRALTDMRQAGLVVRARGAGTRVATGAVAANLLHFTDVHAHGPEVAGLHRVLSAQVLPAGDIGEEVPGLGHAEAVHHLRRVKDDEQGVPTALETHVIPFAVAPHLLREDLAALTSLAYLRSIGAPLSTSRLYLTPMVAGAAEAEALRVPEGSPLFHLRRETYLRDGALGELFIGALSPHAFRLFVEQSVDH